SFSHLEPAEQRRRREVLERPRLWPIEVDVFHGRHHLGLTVDRHRSEHHKPTKNSRNTNPRPHVASSAPSDTPSIPTRGVLVQSRYRPSPTRSRRSNRMRRAADPYRSRYELTLEVRPNRQNACSVAQRRTAGHLLQTWLQ